MNNNISAATSSVLANVIQAISGRAIPRMDFKSE